MRTLDCEQLDIAALFFKGGGMSDTQFGPKPCGSRICGDWDNRVFSRVWSAILICRCCSVKLD